MRTFNLYQNGQTADFLVERTAFDGVKRVAKTVAGDICLVTDILPMMTEDLSQIHKNQVVVAATLGKSEILTKLGQDGKLNLSLIEQKREVYLMEVVSEPFAEHPEITEALVIAGSDKRGTIYGLFHLSELCGVSPLVFWGDVAPKKQTELSLDFDAPILSKEPSVTYRGFFINDEWPAFGMWCNEKFGDVNAKAYDKVFEFLLRMKGNYLWPAMWNSNFSEDGPGIENARLADEYGVVMGSSHHEPLCRAGVEWQRIYKNYGDDSTWSFLSNRDAISRFWADGLLRNKQFENVITIGMRGECDSKLLPENATLKDNIDVVKQAILAQNELIQKHVNSDLKQVPRMLAIYKEVEDYYRGDDTCEGLRDWKELEDVIFMLCDDNFGNMRLLPENGGKNHPGGYGMYYHFDYHGAPISYEWQNSTRLTKTWEQMSMAYEYGIRDMWIVNVGDLKGVEYPLTYFMQLAYDFETWGTTAVNHTEAYVSEWVDTQFGNRINQEQKQIIMEILDGYTKWNSAKRPEAMNPEVYATTSFKESERVANAVTEIIKKADDLKAQIPADCYDAYCSMIYYPAVASMNNILMNIESGINKMLAKKGSVVANQYADAVRKRIADDQRLISEYHALAGGKWNHMMDSAHTCFNNWDDHNWTYPAIQEVVPIPRAKVIASFRGSDAYNLGHYWQDGAPLSNDDFMRPDTKNVVIDIDSRGNVDFSYMVECNKAWLSFSEMSGQVDVKKEGRASIKLTCDRTKLSGEETANVKISIHFANGNQTYVLFDVMAQNDITNQLSKGQFVEQQGYIAMAAEHFVAKDDVDQSGFKVIKHLGKEQAAIKSFPVNVNWMEKANQPSVTYSFLARNEGEYTMEFYFVPRNPVYEGNRMRCMYAVNDTSKQTICEISESFYTEWYNDEWNKGVMNNSRIVSSTVSLKKGENKLTVYAGEPGVILEKIVLYQKDTTLPKSYLGPVESYYRA